MAVSGFWLCDNLFKGGFVACRQSPNQLLGPGELSFESKVRRITELPIGSGVVIVRQFVSAVEVARSSPLQRIQLFSGAWAINWPVVSSCLAADSLETLFPS